METQRVSTAPRRTDTHAQQADSGAGKNVQANINNIVNEGCNTGSINTKNNDAVHGKVNNLTNVNMVKQKDTTDVASSSSFTLTLMGTTNGGS